MDLKELLIAGLMIAVPVIPQSISAGEAGTWTTYPAHGNVTWVEKVGEKVFALDNNSLFLVDLSTGEVRSFDKANALSDCWISKIAWCSQAKRLVILYENHNIDLMDIDGNVVNVSDYYTKSTTLDKTVNGLNVNGNYAYLSTNFGIVQIDVANAVIRNTFNFGFAVNWTHFDSNYIYAESSTEGQYKGSLSANLLDKSQWTRSGEYTAESKKIDETVLASIKSYIPNGPLSPYADYSCFSDGKLYTVPGHCSLPSRPAYLQIYDGSTWTNTSNNISYISSRKFRNLYFVAPYPGKSNRVFLGGETGLYDMVDGKVVKEWWFGNTNNILQHPQSLDTTHTNWSIVSTGAFDSSKNFWCFSGEGEKPGICRLDPSGNWKFYPHEEMRATENTGFIVPASAFFDSRGLLWFTNNDYRTPAIAKYDVDTDQMKAYTSFVNEDGSEVTESYITSIAEDLKGNIWFGSRYGVLYLASDDIYDENPTFQQVKVPRNDGTDLADYLLANVYVNCIAVDGGNRKWFGTETNGVYVVSDDCMTEVHHFTTDNSPLLSNCIEHITIDGTTGDVYISTSKGLCSYRAEATTPQEEMKSSNIYAYPNPVEPSFTGLITINGLSYNSSVKIVTAAGTSVVSGRSTGGSFQWDGCDNEGNKVASGVYTVLAVDQDGKECGGCKVAIIR